jgi:hypothetical protein
MKIEIQNLKDTLSAKGYKWDSKLNIIGIRTTLQVPNVFNDLICVVWKQGEMPSKLSSSDVQMWLNKNLYVGANGKALSLDGNIGPNTEFALQHYKDTVGKERIKTYTITTDPGTYWLLHPLNSKGAAVLKPGQWENCWAMGFHKNKPDHPALVQIANISVYRDGDKDTIAEKTKTVETGLFGINIHGSNKTGVTPSIGKWSAGCQVFQEWSNKEEFLSICKMFKEEKKNKYTYTLIEEGDLV